MATNRANSANPGTASVSQAGATQPVTNAAGSTPASVSVTTFPRPSGQTITVTRLNGAMTTAGASVGDVVERDSDGGFWDANATTPCNVPPDYTSLQVGNDMLSN
jgi:hypothetical protein